MLRNVNVSEYIKERLEQIQEERLMSITEALALSASIARGEPQEAYSKKYDHLNDEVEKEVTTQLHQPLKSVRDLLTTY